VKGGIIVEKKLQIFVSSTYSDLIEERQAAVTAILDAGHIPAGMELFKAGKSQMKTIHKWIDESDVYMLILGGRYGSIEEESGLSYTELEYNYALSRDMPVFAVVLTEEFLDNNELKKDNVLIYEKDNISKYNIFKEKVESNIVKFVANIDQIASNIHSHLNDIMNNCDYNLVGWIKGDSLKSDSVRDDTTTVLPENITHDEYGTCLKLKDSGICICPSCWYIEKKIVPVNSWLGKFVCKSCGHNNKH
jgi:hypothetical protein